MTEGRLIQENVTQEDQLIDAEDSQQVRVGRKRDHSRDAVILDAALEVLAEVGYTRMTMDMVAVRAKAGKGTVYRRWSSKAELVIDAVARMKRSMVDLDRLPDTGSLRGDLVALIKPQSLAEDEHRLKVMGGLSSLLSHDPTFADAVNAAVNEPWVDAYRVLMRRAIDRGEIRDPAHFEILVQVVPWMAAYCVLIQRRSVDRDFLVSVIDGILLPALGAAPD